MIRINNSAYAIDRKPPRFCQSVYF